VEVSVKEGKYIYCIVGSGQSRSFGPLGIGERGDKLYTICFDDLSAVVSDAQIKRYPTSRENTIAHEKAIEEVMKEHTVLPVRFATIANSEEKVKKILKKEYDNFKDLLGKIEGKKELGFKAVFKEDIVYKEILEKYENIKKLKSAITSMPPEKTYYQRMEIGKMVEEALGKERETYEKEILDTLNPLAEDTKINSVYGERMIVNAAFLVNKDKEAEFDGKVNELDAKYSDKIRFKYVGTIPPFNFVNLTIRTEEY